MAATTTNEYRIIGQVCLSDYTKIRDLYKRILSLKKDPYEDLERIVFSYNPASKGLLSIVHDLLDFIDIPTFFVIFNPDSTLPVTEFDFVPTDTHCIYPWINLVVLNDGEIKPCCLYRESITGSPHIQDYSIVDIYNSKYMQDLRQQFRDGQRPTGCASCWANETADITSMRQAAKFKFKELWFDIDYTQDSQCNLQALDLKLGNECNLSCRICMPEFSSTIADIDLSHNLISIERYNNIKSKTTWGQQIEFYNQFESVAANLKYLDIYGGEPLMIRRHYDFLRNLIGMGIASDISIDYNSNGTIYSDSFFEIWQHFKQVKISFSIDNTGPQFELERNGAVWERVQDNIRKFNLKKSEKFQTDVFITVSIMNIYYLPETLAWVAQQGFSQPPSINILETPGYLSINNLTVTAQDLVLNKFAQYNTDPLISSLNTKLNQINAVKSNPEFINYIRRLDKLRNQHFSDTHTEIANAMGIV